MLLKKRDVGGFFDRSAQNEDEPNTEVVDELGPHASPILNPVLLKKLELSQQKERRRKDKRLRAKAGDDCGQHRTGGLKRLALDIVAPVAEKSNAVKMDDYLTRVAKVDVNPTQEPRSDGRKAGWQLRNDLTAREQQDQQQKETTSDLSATLGKARPGSKHARSRGKGGNRARISSVTDLHGSQVRSAPQRLEEEEEEEVEEEEERTEGADERYKGEDAHDEGSRTELDDGSPGPSSVTLSPTSSVSSRRGSGAAGEATVGGATKLQRESTGDATTLLMRCKETLASRRLSHRRATVSPSERISEPAARVRASSRV